MKSKSGDSVRETLTVGTGVEFFGVFVVEDNLQMNTVEKLLQFFGDRELLALVELLLVEDHADWLVGGPDFEVDGELKLYLALADSLAHT